MFGTLGEATAGDATAIGFQAQALGIDATAIGKGAQAKELDSVALGSDAIASGNGSTAVGDNSIAAGDYSVAIGHQAEAKRAIKLCWVVKARHQTAPDVIQASVIKAINMTTQTLMTFVSSLLSETEH